MHAGLAWRTTEQVVLPKIQKLLKYYLFTENISDQKSENFEWIQNDVSGGKRQFQDVLLK